MCAAVGGDRREVVDLSLPRRTEAIHLFGSWFANKNTAAVMKAFDEYGPQRTAPLISSSSRASLDVA